MRRVLFSEEEGSWVEGEEAVWVRWSNVKDDVGVERYVVGERRLWVDIRTCGVC